MFGKIVAARPVASVNRGFESQLRAYSETNYDVYAAQQVLLRNRIRALHTLRGLANKESKFKGNGVAKGQGQIEGIQKGVSALLGKQNSRRELYNGIDSRDKDRDHGREEEPDLSIYIISSPCLSGCGKHKRSWDDCESKHVRPHDDMSEMLHDENSSSLMREGGEDHGNDINLEEDENNYDKMLTIKKPTSFSNNNSNRNSQEDPLSSSSRRLDSTDGNLLEQERSDISRSGSETPHVPIPAVPATPSAPYLDPRSPRCRLSRPGSSTVRVIPPLRGLERGFCCAWCGGGLFCLANVLRVAQLDSGEGTTC